MYPKQNAKFVSFTVFLNNESRKKRLFIKYLRGYLLYSCIFYN